MQGPSYISNSFPPRVTNYYRRGSGINVLQPSYIDYQSSKITNKYVKYSACQCKKYVLKYCPFLISENFSLKLSFFM